MRFFTFISTNRGFITLHKILLKYGPIIEETLFLLKKSARS